MPPLYALRGPPLRLRGPVVRGFGRGSAKMGFPTANIDPAALGAALAEAPRGVYFGWASLGGGAPSKMVMNVGARPTFADGGGLTVEVHLLSSLGREFYGEELRVVVGGFLRPELRFASLQSLVARIRTDVGVARGVLDAPPLAALAEDSFLRF